MTTASLIKQIWALPADERAKIRVALEKKSQDDEFYQNEGMTRAEFDAMIAKSRAGKNNTVAETRQFLRTKRADRKANV